MKSLAKNSAFNAAYNVLSMLFPLISSVYVARILLPIGVGKVAYAQNIASYFVTAAAMGLPTYGMRCVAVAREERPRLNKVFSELILINAVSTTLALAAYFVVLFCVAQFRQELPLYLAAGLLIALNYINIDWLYQGQEEYVYIVCRSLAVKIASFASLFVFVRSSSDYPTYALITSLATAGNNIFNLFNAKKYVSLTLKSLSFRSHLVPIFSLAIVSFFGSIYSKVDTTMLGQMISETSVGYYSYAHKILQIAVSFCTSISAAFLPRLSYYYRHDPPQFHTLVRRGSQLLAFLTLPLATGLWILAPEAIEILFGSNFFPASSVLRVFAPMVVVLSFGNLLCYQMMVASGKEKLLIPVSASAAVINVFLNSLFIPRFAECGAAFASVITELFINISQFVYVKHTLKISVDGKAILFAAFASAVMALAVAATADVFSNLLLSTVFRVLSGIVVYFAVNLLLRNPILKDFFLIIQKAIKKKAKS